MIRRNDSRTLPALLAITVMLLTLVACGGDGEGPTDTPRRDSPTATPVAGADEGSRSSLDEYLAICGIGQTEEAEVDELPLNEMAASFRAQAERLESVEPPAEVAGWRDAIVEYQKAVAERMDDYSSNPQGQSEDEFLLTTLFPLALEYQPAIEAAISGMDPDVRSRMVAAGCIDDETVGVVPSEGTGPVSSEREQIPEGSSVAGSLDEPDETDRFQFQAEAGDYYLIEVTWEHMPRLRLSLFQPPGYTWTSDSEISPISERWTPDVSGTVNISVSASDATGTYVLSISADPSPETPANVTASWEGSGARLTWERVENTEYYKIYFSDFFDSNCSIGKDGTPAFCERLATSVMETEYLHAGTSGVVNYYWVVACNSEGCSQVDTENPATLTADQPGGPTFGGPCQMAIDLQPGDSCFVDAPGGQTGASIFEVRDGEACYGDICSEESIVQDEFLAYANFDDSWFINRLPDGTPSGGMSTPSPAPTRPAEQTAAPTAIASSTRTAPPTPEPPTPSPLDATPSVPGNLRYAFEETGTLITWERVENAEYYEVYHDSFFDSSCSVRRDGTPTFCEQLATSLTETEYLHAGTGGVVNYYWVVACSAGGCSAVDSENPAAPAVARPEARSNAMYTWEGTAVRVSWDAAEGADYYKVYFSDFFDSNCSLNVDGSPRFCEELALDVTETNYLHPDPNEERNYYWIAACNRGGCSEIDSETPARTSP